VALAGGAVHSFTSDGSNQPIAFVTAPVVARFLKNSHDAMIADKVEKKLYYYSEPAAAVWNFASEGEGVVSPVDLAISDTNDRVFVVNENSENIITLSLWTGQVASVACNCVPRSLANVQGSALFAITDIKDSSLLLFQPAMVGGEFLFVLAP
jgi:DNA-binding beta-propeller fold protein YncE